MTALLDFTKPTSTNVFNVILLVRAVTLILKIVLLALEDLPTKDNVFKTVQLTSTISKDFVLLVMNLVMVALTVHKVVLVVLLDTTNVVTFVKRLAHQDNSLKFHQ